MRRADRQVFGEDMNAILLGAKVLRLAMVDDKKPYIVPMNFGAELVDGQFIIYVHAAREGRKIDVLRKNPAVCFEVDGAHALIVGDAACEYGFAYESVIGEGVAEFVEGEAEKIRGLRAIMRHQAGVDVPTFGAAALNAAFVIKISVRTMTGKRCGA